MLWALWDGPHRTAAGLCPFPPGLSLQATLGGRRPLGPGETPLGFPNWNDGTGVLSASGSPAWHCTPELVNHTPGPPAHSRGGLSRGGKTGHSHSDAEGRTGRRAPWTATGRAVWGWQGPCAVGGSATPRLSAPSLEGTRGRGVVPLPCVCLLRVSVSFCGRPGAPAQRYPPRGPDVRTHCEPQTPGLRQPCLSLQRGRAAHLGPVRCCPGRHRSFRISKGV